LTLTRFLRTARNIRVINAKKEKAQSLKI